MKIKTIITAALALVISTACSGAKQEKAMEQKGKALVVFFSHAGDNYAVGNIEVGNTKIVADYITELTGAEQFEIVTHKYDGMAYNPLIKLAQEEANRGELPEYEGDVDMSLKGKTVIPFTTHEGSGLANCANDVKKAFPGANVQKGFSIYGHDVRDGKAKVEKWLNGLGY